ncbi:MAG: hypothetical protein ACTHJH_06520 [Marmoricola sp.]
MQIEDALARLEAARERLALTVDASPPAPLLDRRAAYRAVRLAFDDADALLRAATGLARLHSSAEWSRWRSRLSALDARRQAHLFAEVDDVALLPVGAVRAVDTGMSGPDIGELQHGESCPPGTPATYGLDAEALLLQGEVSLGHPAPCSPLPGTGASLLPIRSDAPPEAA